jgi:hypothetical protein
MLDRETMEAAVIGLTAKCDEIEQKIAEIRKQLGHSADRTVALGGNSLGGHPKPANEGQLKTGQ